MEKSIYREKMVAFDDTRKVPVSAPTEYNSNILSSGACIDHFVNGVILA